MRKAKEIVHTPAADKFLTTAEVASLKADGGGLEPAGVPHFVTMLAAAVEPLNSRAAAIVRMSAEEWGAVRSLPEYVEANGLLARAARACVDGTKPHARNFIASLAKDPAALRCGRTVVTRIAAALPRALTAASEMAHERYVAGHVYYAPGMDEAAVIGDK